MRVKFYIFSLALLASCVAAKRSAEGSPEQAVANGQISAQPAPASPTVPATQVLQDLKIDSNLIPNFHKVNDKIYRSGRPTKDGIAELAKIGVKTILSVQDYGWDKDDADEEKAWASAASIKYLQVPMHGLKKPTVDQIRSALSHLNGASNYPMLVHYEKGSDRTGIVVASYHIKTDGWGIQKAKADMYSYGHSRLLSWWDSILNEI